MSRFSVRRKACVAVLCVAQVVHAAPTLLPLKPGDYVASSYKPCAEAPLAAVVRFDGQAIAGPHESRCTTSILSHKGSTYRISTECRAHGDGTPETPTRTLQTVQVGSATRLALLRQGKPVEYELCPGFH